MVDKKHGRLSANLTLGSIMKSYGRGSPAGGQCPVLGSEGTGKPAAQSRTVSGAQGTGHGTPDTGNRPGNPPLGESRAQEAGSLAVATQKAALERSLSLFVADPSGPQASYHMGMVFQGVEGLLPEHRDSAAASAAGRILQCLDACPKAKRGIAATHVFSRMLPPGALSRKINECMERRQPEPPEKTPPRPRVRTGAASGHADPRAAPQAAASSSSASEDERFHQAVNQWAYRHGYQGVGKSELSRVLRDGFQGNGGRGGAPPARDLSSISIMKPLPKNKGMMWAAAALGALLLVAGTAATVHISNNVPEQPGQLLTANMEEVEASFRRAVVAKEERLKPEKERRQKIADTVIIAASRAIPRAHAGPLSLAQVFDVYDFMLRKIAYRTDSDPLFPQDAEVTLAAGKGDCKSKAALLSAMLESIGAKTLIFASKDANGKGHIYVGVRISSGPAKKQETDRLFARAAIGERYKRQIGRRFGKSGFEPKFREIESADPAIRGTYLLLDSAFENPEDAAPGAVNNDLMVKEYRMVPRPGFKGNGMELD